MPLVALLVLVVALHLAVVAVMDHLIMEVLILEVLTLEALMDQAHIVLVVVVIINIRAIVINNILVGKFKVARMIGCVHVGTWYLAPDSLVVTVGALGLNLLNNITTE